MTEERTMKSMIAEVRALRDSEHYEEALATCQRLLAQYPDRYEGYLERCGVYELQGDEERALIDADAAVGLAPKEATALFVRGQLLLEQGRYQDSLSDLKSVIAIEREQNDPYLTKAAEIMSALSLLRLGRLAESLEICQRVQEGKWFVCGSLYTVDRIATLARR